MRDSMAMILSNRSVGLEAGPVPDKGCDPGCDPGNGIVWLEGSTNDRTSGTDPTGQDQVQPAAVFLQ